MTPMEITLRFFANFRDEVGQKSISRTYDATTVGEVLTALEAEFPDPPGWDGAGQRQRAVERA
jgi:molybdopterin synthase sulfur carrier subunit